MEKADKWIFGIVFGAVIPVFTFLLFWWSSMLFIENEKDVMIIALGGLLFGLLIDFMIKRTYSGAYPPINSGRIKSARAAIKSVIPADMHPF